MGVEEYWKANVAWLSWENILEGLNITRNNQTYIYSGPSSSTAFFPRHISLWWLREENKSSSHNSGAEGDPFHRFVQRQRLIINAALECDIRGDGLIRSLGGKKSCSSHWTDVNAKRRGLSTRHASCNNIFIRARRQVIYRAGGRYIEKYISFYTCSVFRDPPSRLPWRRF
jgi:hypothetical protein